MSPVQRFQHHVYDVNITSVYRSIETLVSEQETTQRKLNVSEYLSSIRGTMDAYCQTHRLSFDSCLLIGRPVIINSNDHAFPFMLALFLIGLDLYRIENVLDYHLKQYRKKGDFVKMIEFSVCQFIKDNQPSPDPERLSAITDWVKKKRLVASDVQLNFSWKDDTFDLQAFSRKLYHKGYTKYASDFEAVFRKKKRIKWQKSPGELAYLLYLLYKRERVINCHPNGAYLKLAIFYFGFSDDFGAKVVSEKSLKNILYNITKRQSEKYSKTRDSIEKLLPKNP